MQESTAPQIRQLTQGVLQRHFYTPQYYAYREGWIERLIVDIQKFSGSTDLGVDRRAISNPLSFSYTLLGHILGLLV